MIYTTRLEAVDARDALNAERGYPPAYVYHFGGGWIVIRTWNSAQRFAGCVLDD